MIGHKWINESKILGRSFHVDVFESKTTPIGIVLWFGGSAMTKPRYKKREKMVVPIFDKVWHRLGQDLPLIFALISGPYDINILRFSESNLDKNKWNQHVEKEILGNWPDLPVYLIGNSAGGALAFNGVHKIDRVVGAGGIGADQIPKDFQIPLRKNGQPEWILSLYYNYNDPVYSINKAIVNKLIRTGLATCDRFGGQHETIYYLENRSFDDLIYKALKSFK